MNARVCRCGCGASLAGLRSDAIYHSEACKKRAQRAKRRDKGGTRRPSRDGNGVRLYLTVAEARDWQAGFLGAGLREKLDRAAGKVAGGSR